MLPISCRLFLIGVPVNVHANQRHATSHRAAILFLFKIFPSRAAPPRDVSSGFESHRVHPTLLIKVTDLFGSPRHVMAGIKPRGLRSLDRRKRRMAANDAGYFCVARNRSHKTASF
jgi:hypothetical protein